MSDTASSLPIRIMYMVRALHARGYASLYLNAGLAPSGGYWRFSIGVIDNGEWPKGVALVSGSVGSKGQLPWCEDASVDASRLADAFETFYTERLAAAQAPNAAYMRWYAEILDSLPEGKPLVFFADFPAPHAALLADAPGYIGKLRS